MQEVLNAILQVLLFQEASLMSKELHDITPAEPGSVRLLGSIFGHTVNAAGYKELDSHIGLIYGDSITPPFRAATLLERLATMGYASNSCVFGIGSYTYNYSTRDSIGAAMKSTYGAVNGETRVIFKDPVTDNGTKRSAKGLLRFDPIDGGYAMKDNCTEEEEAGGELQIIFKDGELFNPVSLHEIRARLA
jgi:nicotinamide phosphoribosyltransferase